MKILVTGSSGFIGSALVPYLRKQGHEEVVRLVRLRSHRSEDAILVEDSDALEGFDAVINLRGENIANQRWSTEKKKRIKDSRVVGTKELVDAFSKVKVKPKVWLNASAIGYYGDRKDLLLDEASSHGEGFLPEVCAAWEATLRPLKALGIRVLSLRFGLVIGPGSLVLKKMRTPFKLCLGGVIGSGKQYVSWIALKDLLKAVTFLLEHEEIEGAVNVVGPEAVTMREFVKTFGKVLHRPAVCALPAVCARLLFGEMANETFLASTRVVPSKLLSASFSFSCPHLEQAFKEAE